MSYDGRAIANRVLDIADKEGISLSNLALQKVVYFCHVWHLVETQEPLVKHDFEAWQHGPVLQYLYRQFKSFESSPITTRATSLDPLSGQQRMVSAELPDDLEERILKVVSFYGKLPPWDLVDLSHEAGGPWEEIWYFEGKVNPGMKISNDAIVSFYSRADPMHRLQ